MRTSAGGHVPHWRSPPPTPTGISIPRNANADADANADANAPNMTSDNDGLSFPNPTVGYFTDVRGSYASPPRPTGLDDRRPRLSGIRLPGPGLAKESCPNCRAGCFAPGGCSHGVLPTTTGRTEKKAGIGSSVAYVGPPRATGLYKLSTPSPNPRAAPLTSSTCPTCTDGCFAPGGCSSREFTKVATFPRSQPGGPLLQGDATSCVGGCSFLGGCSSGVTKSQAAGGERKTDTSVGLGPRLPSHDDMSPTKPQTCVKGCFAPGGCSTGSAGAPWRPPSSSYLPEQESVLDELLMAATKDGAHMDAEGERETSSCASSTLAGSVGGAKEKYRRDSADEDQISAAGCFGCRWFGGRRKQRTRQYVGEAVVGRKSLDGQKGA